jgi:hypothetical protein
MKNDQSFRRFEYRPCRITAGFDLEFVADGKTLLGICSDVSDEGIRATLDGAVVVGSFGLVVFRHSTGLLELEAQVAYIDERQVGLVFLFQTSWERGMVTSLIASIQNNPDDSLIVPFR